MTAFRKALLFIIPLSFGLGTYWGVRYFKRTDQVEYSNQIRVLTLPGLLPAELVQKIQTKHSVNLVLDIAQDPVELAIKYEGHISDYDLAFLFSYDLARAIQSHRVVELPHDILPLLKLVSPDFVKVPDLVEELVHIPILWGVQHIASRKKTELQEMNDWPTPKNIPAAEIRALRNAASLFFFISQTKRLAGEKVNDDATIASFAKVVKSIPLSESFWLQHPIPPETQFIEASNGELAFLDLEAPGAWKPLSSPSFGYWFLSAVIPASAEVTKARVRVLTDLLSAESMGSIIQSSHQATTLQSVESTKIDNRLKPSHFRTYPLEKLQAIRAPEQIPLLKNMMQNGLLPTASSKKE